MNTDVAIAELTAKVDALAERAEPWPPWLTVPSAARYTDTSVSSIRRLLAAGKLAAHRPTGRRVLIDREQLDGVIRGSTRQLRKRRVGR